MRPHHTPPSLSGLASRALLMLALGLALILSAGCGGAPAAPADAPAEEQGGIPAPLPDAIPAAPSLAAFSHGAPILDVALSPAGDRLATAGKDGTAQIWDVASGRQLATVAHDGQVNSVAFNGDGALVATASRDGTARVSETATGAEYLLVSHGTIDSDDQVPLGASYGVGDPMPALEVLFTGGALASLGADGQLHIWHLRYGTEEAQYWLRNGPSYAFSHSDDQVAITGAYGDESGEVKVASLLYERQYGDNVGLLPTGAAAVVGYSADDAYLVAAADEQAQVWSVADGCVVGLVAGRQARVSADGSRLAVSTGADAVEVYSLPELTLIGKRAFPGMGQAVTLSPDGAFAAVVPGTAMADATAIIWAIDADAFYAAQHQAPVFAAAFSADGRTLATASGASAVLWQTPEMAGHALRQPPAPAAPLGCLQGEGVPGLPPPPTATPDARYSEEERTYMRLMEQNGSAILITSDEVDRWAVRLAVAPEAAMDELTTWVGRLSHNLERARQITPPARFSAGHAQYLAAVELLDAANSDAFQLSVMPMGPEADAETADAISAALLDGGVALEQALNAMGIPFTNDEDALPTEEPLPSGAPGRARG